MGPVQIGEVASRRVAFVDEPRRHFLAGVWSVCALASPFIREHASLSEEARRLATGESLTYEGVCERKATGTEITHLGSAKDRQAMHEVDFAASTGPITNSRRMFHACLESRCPKQGKSGIVPAWFYKG